MTHLTFDACLRTSPSPEALDFRDTHFFCANGSGTTAVLPSPAAVRALRSNDTSGHVIFEDLGLFVKFGETHKVSIEEAQTLQAIRRAFPNEEIPVPELYGWRRSDGINFIYLSLVRGVSLETCWSTLNGEEKTSISKQLEHIDIFFHADVNAGPFHTVKEFNDRFQFWALSWLPLSQRPPDPFRSLLTDASDVFFSHSDLHLDNILIAGEPGSRSIAAIADWGMSGWYPEYWEYCKMLLGTGDCEFDTEGWLTTVLRKSYDEEWAAFVNYWQCRGVP